MKTNRSPICLLCFGNKEDGQMLKAWFWGYDCICGNCRKQWQEANKYIVLDGLMVHVLYRYEAFLENILFQYKESRDVALSSVFFTCFRKEIKRRYRGYTMVLMPSSQSKVEERGFHHLRRMVVDIGLPIIEPFIKIDDYKQSRQQGSARKEIEKHMQLNTACKIPQTPLLLVDDVCTTGATIVHAYHLLEAHTMHIEALVLSAHDLLLKEAIQPKSKNYLFRREGNRV